VVEHVGAATWDESLRSLKSGGKLVTCGATTGSSVGMDLRHLFARQLTLLGSYMGTMSDCTKCWGTCLRAAEARRGSDISAQ